MKDSYNPGEGPHIVSASADTLLHPLCDSLSLTCDSFVHASLWWNDYGQVSAFSRPQTNRSWRTPPYVYDSRTGVAWSTNPNTGTVRVTNNDLRVPRLTLDQLQKAWDIHHALERRSRSDNRFRIAVSRWMRSIRPDLEQSDHFIDLRIALEALYLDGDPGEQTFRLAIRGAWHLGSDSAMRTDIRKKLTEFYRLASRVVHGTVPSQGPELLSEARKLCRMGILKAIGENQRPDWDALILGHETA